MIWIKQFLTSVGKTLTLETVDSNLLALATSIPLARFASAHKGALAKMPERYVDE